jgi:hypothetical protein
MRSTQRWRAIVVFRAEGTNHIYHLDNRGHLRDRLPRQPRRQSPYLGESANTEHTALRVARFLDPGLSESRSSVDVEENEWDNQSDDLVLDIGSDDGDLLSEHYSFGSEEDLS